MRKRSILTIITLAALELGVMTAVTQVNQPTVSAQSRKATVVYNMKNPTIRLKVTKGNIWSNSSLTKVKYHAQNYKKDIFYSSRHATIKATNGKKRNYWLISNKSGSVKGWIWAGNTKKIDDTAHVVISSGWRTYGQKAKPTKTAKDDTTQKQTHDFSLNDYRESFLKYLNQERNKRNLAPVKIDDRLEQLAQQRAEEMKKRMSHYDSDGTYIAMKEAPSFGITNFVSECLGGDSLNSTTGEAYWTGVDASAKDLVNGYINHDEASNNGHKDAFLDPNHTLIGIGANYDKSTDTVHEASELSY